MDKDGLSSGSYEEREIYLPNGVTLKVNTKQIFYQQRLFDISKMEEKYWAAARERGLKFGKAEGGKVIFSGRSIIRYFDKVSENGDEEGDCLGAEA